MPDLRPRPDKRSAARVPSLRARPGDSVTDVQAVEFLKEVKRSLLDFARAQEIHDPLLMDRVREYIRRASNANEVPQVFPLLQYPPDVLEKVLDKAIAYAERL